MSSTQPEIFFRKGSSNKKMFFQLPTTNQPVLSSTYLKLLRGNGSLQTPPAVSLTDVGNFFNNRSEVGKGMVKNHRFFRTLEMI
jgi:hypothetical protein